MLSAHALYIGLLVGLSYKFRCVDKMLNKVKHCMLLLSNKTRKVEVPLPLLVTSVKQTVEAV